MTRAELDAIAARNAERKKDPSVHYQWGCGGTTRGVHHHDDHCAPPSTVDIDALLGEVGRLRMVVEGDFTDWMKCDAITVRDTLRNGCVCGDYPHETEGREKLFALLATLAGDNDSDPNRQEI